MLDELILDAYTFLFKDLYLFETISIFLLDNIDVNIEANNWIKIDTLLFIVLNVIYSFISAGNQIHSICITWAICKYALALQLIFSIYVCIAIFSFQYG